MGEHRLRSVTIDPESLAPASPELEHDREVAIADLLDENSFRPEGAAGGPYHLRISSVENRLALEVDGPGYRRAHVLALSPLRSSIRDYMMICESYQEAIREASPNRIESVDMGRRGLHDEAARVLQERLAGKITLDLDTARRLFTLICALHRRG